MYNVTKIAVHALKYAPVAIFNYLRKAATVVAPLTKNYSIANLSSTADQANKSPQIWIACVN